MNEWYLNDTQVGQWQTSRNLSYAKVSIPTFRSPQLKEISDLRFIPYGMLFLECFSDLTSYQVGFDVPHVTNDMILRFMDVDFSLIPGLAASSKSRIGNDDRVSLSFGPGAAAGIPLLKGGSTDWEGGTSISYKIVCSSCVSRISMV